MDVNFFLRRYWSLKFPELKFSKERKTNYPVVEYVCTKKGTIYGIITRTQV